MNNEEEFEKFKKRVPELKEEILAPARSTVEKAMKILSDNAEGYRQQRTIPPKMVELAKSLANIKGDLLFTWAYISMASINFVIDGKAFPEGDAFAEEAKEVLSLYDAFFAQYDLLKAEIITDPFLGDE